MSSDASTVPVARFLDGAFQWQEDALAAFDEGRARFAHIWVHRRGRKSTLGVNLLIREACNNPKQLYRYVAPTRVEAKSIVWDDPDMLFSHLPPKEFMGWEANKSEMSVLFANGSRITLEGADKISDSHRGKACHGVVFDEWAFHESPNVWFSVFRPMIAEDASRWAWFLTTPNGTNHAFDMFHKARESGRADTYTRILRASESAIITQKELDLARDEMPLALFLQEFECEAMVSSDRVLIQPAQIERLKEIHHGQTQVRRIISCDPAMDGDQCVIMANQNGEIVEKKSFHPHTTIETAAQMKIMGDKWQTQNYIVDKIGIGQGVYDGINAYDDTYVQGFNSSERSEREKTPAMYNRRAEAWWYTMEQIVAGNIPYPEDPDVRKQLSSVLYEVAGNGAIKMEKKDAVRKRLGRSPDDGDTFVMAQWGLKNTQPVGGGTRRSHGVHVPRSSRARTMVA